MRTAFTLLAPLALLLAAPAAAQATVDLTPRLEALAQAGSGEAAYHLGMIHHLGLEGAARDPRRALEYFRLAAEQGDPLGAYKVGCFYAGQGEGVVEDDAELALRHKLVAAEAGYALAQQDVAKIYWAGGDHAAAMRWFDSAARQGDLTALASLAAIHGGDVEAPAVERDPALAYAFFTLFVREIAEVSEAVDVAQGADMMRKKLDIRPDEVARGDAIIAEWRAEPTALTRKAAAGLDAAKALVATR